MKQLRTKFMSMLAIAGVIGFASCGGDEEVETVAPTVVVTYTGDANVPAGTEIEATVAFTAGAGIAGINLTPIIDGTAGDKSFNAPSEFGVAAGDTVGTFVVTYNPAASLIGSTVEWEIEVVDAEDRTAVDDFSITVISALRNFTAVLLEAPIGSTPGTRTSETFYSIAEGATYSAEDVVDGPAGTSAKIDFGYYYGNTNEASIAAPANYPSLVYDLAAQGWGTRNATLIRSTSMTEAEFNEVTTLAEIETAFNGGTNENGNITNLAVGDVFAFETASTSTNGVKKGLALVTALVATANSNGEITLEIITE
ncbi:hypothetical protein QWY31_08840 [Cytophagales bacterium LB-30]|uniref:DUF5017 domain-containing protein n=1 Tax=Shiella aurantiaca TaxID=3058365 RepID=A0ABT8F6K8_9BACT|nr:hypothetical protein [Shiella aurantiaca]MDN4165606.1 hypothetical protein [Shiella aurantiaca]